MIKKVICFLILSLFLKNSNPANLQTPNRSLTISEAVNMALRNRPSLKALKSEINAQKMLAKKTLSGYLPQIAGSSSAAFIHHKKGLRENLSLEISQLLYSFAGPLDEYKIAKKDIEVAKYATEIHENLIKNQVENLFLKTWITKYKINFIKSLEKASKKRFEKEKNKKTVNLSDKNEWLKARATYAKEFSDIASYTDQLQSTQKSLEYYIGKKLFDTNQTTLIWNYKSPIHIEPIAQYYKKALKFRPEIKSKEEEIEKSRLQSNYYIKQYLPSLSLKGSASYNKQLLTTISSYRQIGIQADWNLFDGLSSKHASDASNARRIKSIMEKEDLTQKIKLEVEQKYYQLTTLFKELKAENEAIPLYKNKLLLSKKEFDLGLISNVEFETAREHWEEAKLGWLEIRVAVELKKKDLDFVCGYPNRK